MQVDSYFLTGQHECVYTQVLGLILIVAYFVPRHTVSYVILCLGRFTITGKEKVVNMTVYSCRQGKTVVNITRQGKLS